MKMNKLAGIVSDDRIILVVRCEIGKKFKIISEY